MSSMKYAELRIKVKSLAAEIALIHQDEIRLKGRARRARGGGFEDRDHVSNFQSLRSHRQDLKEESRAALLALTFLRGHPYDFHEKASQKEVPFERVKEIAKKFGRFTWSADKWEAWQKAGIEHWKAAQSVVKSNQKMKGERTLHRKSPEGQVAFQAKRAEARALWEGKKLSHG